MSSQLPQCDFCEDEAKYDARTLFGPWANMCESDFQQYGVGKLGLGYGQSLDALVRNNIKGLISGDK